MGKLFGTDGIRGVANRDLTPEMAYQIGRILTSLLKNTDTNPFFLIGRDTRLSGSMLEGSLVAGITSAGGDVKVLGIASTPAVAYLTKKMGASAGIVISASHNPIEDNGLKIFNNDGFKLADSLEEQIEHCYYNNLDSLPRPEGLKLGQAYNDHEAYEQYLLYLRNKASQLNDLSLVIDCAHGAACRVAAELFQGLNAKVKMIHDTPDGRLINVKCGATDTGNLQKAVRENKADIGLAFDGDADRLIAIDEKGDIVDGDAVMSICAIYMSEERKLRNNTLVATVMSNGGLDLLAEQYGFNVIRTTVGDRYVLETMLKGDYNLGGEQSGHIIFSDHSTSGDGLLTALQLLAIMTVKGKPLSELASVLERMPQVLVNQPVNDKEGWSENAIIHKNIELIKTKIGKYGRILVRPSGTEKLIRVMIEAPLPEDDLEILAKELAGVIGREQS